MRSTEMSYDPSRSKVFCAEQIAVTQLHLKKTCRPGTHRTHETTLSSQYSCANCSTYLCSCDRCQAPTTAAQNYVNQVLQDFSVRVYAISQCACVASPTDTRIHVHSRPDCSAALSDVKTKYRYHTHYNFLCGVEYCSI